MKKKIGPNWNKDQEAERQRQEWETFFSEGEDSEESEMASSLGNSEELKLDNVRARYEAELLCYPNVIGVDKGIKTVNGKPTGEVCIIVYVDHKIPKDELSEEDILPDQIETVQIDVVAIGEIRAL